MEVMPFSVIVMAYSQPFVDMVGHTFAAIFGSFSLSKTHYQGFNMHFSTSQDVALELLFWPVGRKGPWKGSKVGTIWAKGGKVRVMRPLLLPTQRTHHTTALAANIGFTQNPSSFPKTTQY